MCAPSTCQLVGGLPHQPVSQPFIALLILCTTLGLQLQAFLSLLLFITTHPWHRSGIFEVITFSAFHPCWRGPAEISPELVMLSKRSSSSLQMDPLDFDWSVFFLSLSCAFPLPGIYVLAVTVETRHTNTVAVDRKCCGTTMASLRLCTHPPLSVCLSQPACMLLSLAGYKETAPTLSFSLFSLISLIIISIAFSAVSLSFLSFIPH